MLVEVSCSVVEVVVVAGTVVSRTVEVVVVVDGMDSVVYAQSGTISHPRLSMFHASIKHVPPPYSKNQPSMGCSPDRPDRSAGALQEHPFKFQVPNCAPPIEIVPPSSAATMNWMLW